MYHDGMYQLMTCPNCFNPCAFVYVKGLTITVCTYCCDSMITETKVIIRLDRNMLNNVPLASREFLAVAMTMQKVYESWETILIHVPMAE